jgi:hypothetical protein
LPSTWFAYAPHALLHSPVGAPPSSPSTPFGFSPAQIQQAYGFNQIAFNATPGNGSGTTIAIVDAYDDPNIATDLQTFDAQFGLPNPSLTKMNQNGGASLPAGNISWGAEESIDVEWAHAIAPQASIILVECNSNMNSDLMTGVATANKQPGVVAVSMSFFSGTEYSGETGYDSLFTQSGVTYVACSGDFGAPASYPAVSPNVLAVGGTSLSLQGNGTWSSETGWYGSGGGISSYESQPTYQNGVVTQSSTSRTNPDVAYDADEFPGFAVYDTYGYGGWTLGAGTSEGAPQWAALVAIADQGRKLAGSSSLSGSTQTLPMLYSMPGSFYHDITTGNNGYSAGPGYDLVTGRGTPLANLIVPYLAGYLFPVTNTSDTANAGSLRWAITQADSRPGSTIAFSINGGGLQTIIPASALPAITTAVTIDGTTQPGYAGTPLIQLDGANAGSASGLLITGSGATVRELDINRFSLSGITIFSSAANHDSIQGDYLGTDPTGSQALANGFDGVLIYGGATSNTVGGAGAARNLISANAVSGVDIQGSGTTGNQVIGNYIGTDVSGSLTLGNGTNGVSISAGAAGNTIGAVGGANLISANGTYGITIQGVGTTGNLVLGNVVGTDVTGRYRLGNRSDGILVFNGATGNTIGGTTSGTPNLISGNAANGIDIQGGGTSSNQVIGNFIGTDQTGSVALANGTNGVNLAATASGNTIGGTAPGAGNVISGNSIYGVNIQDSGTTMNLVVGNDIGTDFMGTHALGNIFGGIAIYNGAGGNTVGGTSAGARNLISGNVSNGVAIANAGTTGNLVLGNYVGTDVTGSLALGNKADGIVIDGGAAGNTVGGTSTGARNVISGNTAAGVDIQGSGTTNNQVIGNSIGTDGTGLVTLPNGYGVNLAAAASNNTIGGAAAGSANLIAGNSNYGVNIQDSGTTGNVVEGNLIGTDATGAAPKGNVSGIVLSGTSGNTIGGTTSSARNVISGNSYAGVVLVNAAAGNLIEGNFIGTDVTGTKAVANRGFGVLAYFAATGNTLSGNLISGNGGSGIDISGSGTNANVVVGNDIGTDVSVVNPLPNQYYGVGIDTYASNNTIGGIAAGAANVIAFNAAAGVYVGSGTGNSVRGNSLFANAALGIDLAPVGPNANQPGGGGAGPNNLQDYPVFSSVNLIGNTATVQGSFPAAPNSTYTLDFYANAGAGFSVYYQGQTYLGSLSVTSSSAGTASFQATFSNIPAGQTYLTATATDAAGDTSEFCLPFASMADVANYVVATQLPNGAIRQSLLPSWYDTHGTPYYEVDPYFADLGIQGLLAVSPGVSTVDPRAVAASYFQWYLGHLNPDGTIDNFYYYADDSQPNAAPPPQDSNDGYASTFLSAVWQYHQAGGSGSFFQMPGVQAELEQVGQVLHDTQLPNGLTQTFLAGGDTYTEDNSESYSGFQAMSLIESQIYHNTTASQTYAAAASRCQSAILTYLYNSSTGLFNIDPTTLADTTQWYPGTITLAWPSLFGVIAPTGTTALAQMSAIDSAWNGSGQPDWTTLADTGEIGLAALLSGDTTRAQNDESTLARDPYPTQLITPPGAVFTVADAGWLLRLLNPTANRLAVNGLGSSVAGTAFTITVTAQDPYGNVSTGYRGTVHFTSSDPRATLPADYTFTSADNGVHTFSATLFTAGAQTVTATDTYTAITGSGQGSVSPSAAATLLVTAPTSSIAGQAFTVTVTALDAYGNTATGYRGTIHFRSSDGQAGLPVNYTFTASDAGVHTFVNTFTLKTVGSQTITATDTTTPWISNGGTLHTGQTATISHKATASITGTATVVVSAAGADAYHRRISVLVIKGPLSALGGTALDASGDAVRSSLRPLRFANSEGTVGLPMTASARRREPRTAGAIIDRSTGKWTSGGTPQAVERRSLANGEDGSGLVPALVDAYFRGLAG